MLRRSSSPYFNTILLVVAPCLRPPSAAHHRAGGSETASKLKNKLTQILILQNIRQPLADVSSGDGDFFLSQVGAFETDGLEDPFEDRVKAAGADVLSAAVEVVRDLGHGFDRVVVKVYLDPFGGQQSGLLLRKRIAGL